MKLSLDPKMTRLVSYLDFYEKAIPVQSGMKVIVGNSGSTRSQLAVLNTFFFFNVECCACYADIMKQCNRQKTCKITPAMSNTSNKNLVKSNLVCVDTTLKFEYQIGYVA